MEIDNKWKYFHLALVWITLLIPYPFVIIRSLGNLPAFVIETLFILILVILLCFRKFKVKYLYNANLILSLLLFFYLFQFLYHSAEIYFINILSCLYVLIILLYTASFIGVDLFLKSYVTFVLINVLCGTLGFLIVALFNIQPLISFEAYDGREAYFFGLTYTNVYLDYANMTLIRYSGFFDEPGTIAFFGAYALIINRLLFRRKTIEFILLFFLVLTFSIAHIIFLFFYFLFFSPMKSKKNIFIFVLFLLSFIFLYYLKYTDYGYIYDLTLGRFELNNGEMEGNNRSDAIKIAMDLFTKNPLLGIGADYKSPRGFFGANIIAPLATDGLIGFIFKFSPFFFMVYLAIEHYFIKRNMYLLKSSFLLLLLYLQRPNVDNIFELFSLILLLYTFSMYSKEKHLCLLYEKE